MASQRPQYFATTNANRPQNNQSGIIFGKIDYVLKDFGQWQNDGSVIIDFSTILAENVGFYPQTLIVTNPNGDALAVAVNPSSVNYRISIGAASQVRDLCPSFLNGLVIQFGPLLSPYVWQPVTFILTNFPLVPDTVSLWKPQGNSGSFGTLSAIVLSTLPVVLYQNNTGSPVLLNSIQLQYYNLGGTGPQWVDYLLSINSLTQNFLVTMPIDDVSGTFSPTVFNFPDFNLVLMPGDKLYLSVRDFSTLFTGYIDVNIGFSKLVYML